MVHRIDSVALQIDLAAPRIVVRHIGWELHIVVRRTVPVASHTEHTVDLAARRTEVEHRTEAVPHTVKAHRIEAGKMAGHQEASPHHWQTAYQDLIAQDATAVRKPVPARSMAFRQSYSAGPSDRSSAG